MGIALFAIYGCCMLYIFFFGLVQCHLTLSYRKNALPEQNIPEGRVVSWPVVTVQLPVYNEKYVVERLIDCIAAFDYPRELLEIQVLDDSTDETSGIIAGKVAEYRARGFDIAQVRRKARTGFKAGALQNGLVLAKGDFIAIFDADFLPQKDFLKKTLPHFQRQAIGMVQTKWAHLNGDFSLLTRLQAFGLNGHFSVEQGGRSSAGSFINFNGTAGVWRRKCIADAGGWQADTLTEDLDLSYRAQLKGWKFKYLEHVTSPAELPVIMSALKTQQFRWNKGGAETARKNLLSVLRSRQTLKTKIHAFFHLTGSANFLLLLVASLTSIPLLLVKPRHPELDLFWRASALFVVGFVAISYFYWESARRNYDEPGKYYLKYFPLFLVFSMGMALHNGIAVLEGLLGIKSPFLRTPKFNVVEAKGSWKSNTYVSGKISLATLLEAVLCLYFLFGAVHGFAVNDLGLVFFHLMLAVGYGGVFVFSIKR